MTLADISIDPSAAPVEIKSWLEALAFFVGLIYLLILVMKELRQKPARPDNTLLDQRVSQLEASSAKITAELKEEREKNEIHMSSRSKTVFDAMEKTRVNMEARMDAQAAAGEESRMRLHERINPVVENTARISGQMEAFTTSFNNFTQMMSAMMKERK